MSEQLFLQASSEQYTFYNSASLTAWKTIVDSQVKFSQTWIKCKLQAVTQNNNVKYNIKNKFKPINNQDFPLILHICE